MEKNILTVIPARGGSKGVPRKNIKDMNGKPLIFYAIQAALQAKNVGRVIVSTDDEEIAGVAIACGAEVPFMRPPDLGQDLVMAIHVMRHAMEYFDQRGERYDGILSLQCTCPLIKPTTIDAVIDKFIQTDCRAVTTVAEIRHGHPFLTRRLTGPDNDEMADFYDLPEGIIRYPRQKREKAYYTTGSMYLRHRTLLEEFDISSNCLGSNPKIVLIDDPRETINIDDILDFKLAEILIRERMESAEKSLENMSSLSNKDFDQ